MKRILEQQFENVNVFGSTTRNQSGAFEVINARTQKVYFSRLNGDGFLDKNPAKLSQLVRDLESDGAIRVKNPPHIARGDGCAIV